MQLSQTDKGTVSGAENKFMSDRERKRERERERETSWSLRVFAGFHVQYVASFLPRQAAFKYLTGRHFNQISV